MQSRRTLGVLKIKRYTQRLTHSCCTRDSKLDRFSRLRDRIRTSKYKHFANGLTAQMVEQAWEAIAQSWVPVPWIFPGFFQSAQLASALKLWYLLFHLKLHNRSSNTVYEILYTTFSRITISWYFLSHWMGVSWNSRTCLSLESHNPLSISRFLCTFTILNFVHYAVNRLCVSYLSLLNGRHKGTWKRQLGWQQSPSVLRFLLSRFKSCLKSFKHVFKKSRPLERSLEPSLACLT